MKNSSKSSQTFVEKCYKNSEGKVVFAQSPNLPILVWATGKLLLLLVPTTSGVHTPLTILTTGTLFTWAWLELFAGTTYLRRLLGFVVLVSIVL